jgi:DHA3 family tetracycline resistance protein-like MFS transporter
VISLSSQMDAIGQIAGGPLVGLIGNWSVRLAITGSGLLLTPVLALYANTLKRSTAEASARDAVQSDQM